MTNRKRRKRRKMKNNPTDRQEEAYGKPSATEVPITPDQYKKIMAMSRKLGVTHPQTDFTKTGASSHIYDLDDINDGRLDVKDFNAGLVLYGGELMTTHERRVAEADKRAKKRADKKAIVRPIDPIDPINTIPDMIDAAPVIIERDPPFTLKEESGKGSFKNFPDKPYRYKVNIIERSIEENATPGEPFTNEDVFRWFTKEERKFWFKRFDEDIDETHIQVAAGCASAIRSPKSRSADFVLERVPHRNKTYIYQPDEKVVEVVEPAVQNDDKDVILLSDWGLTYFATTKGGEHIYEDIDGHLGRIGVTFQDV